MKQTAGISLPRSPVFNGPLFIVGMPRSGTKLLRELLNQHTHIRINKTETEFLPYLVNHWSSFGGVSDIKKFCIFYAHITRLPYFIYRAEMGCLVNAQVWHSTCREYTPEGVFEALIRLDVGAPFGSHYIWGDKSPSYIRHLVRIKALYPKARFIHIIRDVRDYCLSINKAWGKDMPRAAQRWAEDVDATRIAGIELGNSYLELHYEDLLADTEYVLRRICAFTGIDFDPAMLVLDKPSENFGDARDVSYVKSDNLNKFLKYMDPPTLNKIEALAGETMTACGYALTQHQRPRVRLSAFEMRTAQLCDAINLLRLRHKKGIWEAIKFYFRYFMATRG